jgi:hypothetical protein
LSAANCSGWSRRISYINLGLHLCGPLCYYYLVAQPLYLSLDDRYVIVKIRCGIHMYINRFHPFCTCKCLRSSSHLLTGISLLASSFHSFAVVVATRLTYTLARASSLSSVFFSSYELNIVMKQTRMGSIQTSEH